MSPERVLVAMSGGVDSAVAAALLHRSGYDVVGVTLRLYTQPDDAALSSGRTCCGVEEVDDARRAAQLIGIPHYVLNMEREFKRDVIDGFVDAYARGRTPNPCLECNRRVKFRTLLDRALAMGADRLATGHYARIDDNAETAAPVDGSPARRRLRAAADPAKDQSYVLYTLGQRELARTLFPLGGMTKTETRVVARELGLGVAEKPDSVDICFVPGGDYRRLLADQGLVLEPGVVVDAEGREVGRHRGAAGYTVGQRRGLVLSESGPGARRFVTAVDAERNVVVVGGERELQVGAVEASAPSWVVEAPRDGERLGARLRYGAPLAPGRVESVSDGGFRLALDRPVRTPAPGQAVVLYRPSRGRGDEVVGGGTVEAITPWEPRRAASAALPRRPSRG